MNTDCDICQFLAKPLRFQLITTDLWTVGLIPNQAYLGRALLTLRTHKGHLGDLSQDEWDEFKSIFARLETAYGKALGASPINIGNFMNHAYRDDPPHPHIHWQLFPRHRRPIEIEGVTFEDPRYGEFYDDSAKQNVPDELLAAIVARLKAHL